MALTVARATMAPHSLIIPGRLVVVASLALTLNIAPTYFSLTSSATGAAKPNVWVMAHEAESTLNGQRHATSAGTHCVTYRLPTRELPSAGPSQDELGPETLSGVSDATTHQRIFCDRRTWDTPDPLAGAPAQPGRVILISISQEWLWAYEDGVMQYANPVTTGMPGLKTPLGSYQVMAKQSNSTFYSPWAPSSPFYYTPEHINYALLFRVGGFYIHDAPWRALFGPGTNVPHFTPSGKLETGSHGCVNVSTRDAAWLYAWAQPGTTVLIVA